ncbi:MAG: PQQ-binding-like beta-propeller repeat protein [Bacteroidales bacterium]|nr:PQQ-binding-like beta-propeller repeat protein [Bacteroidales bacterium]
MDEKTRIKLVSQLMAVAGLFTLIVALLLLLNYLHVRYHDPLESVALTQLVEQFKSNPESETLIRDIRNLDLLARKAYFTSQWQIKTGAFLLLAGAIAFAVLLRIYHSLKARIGEPLISGGNLLLNRIVTQRWILGIGAILFIGAVIGSLVTVDYLDKYQKGELTGEVVAEAVTEETQSDVEVIDLIEQEEEIDSRNEVDPPTIDTIEHTNIETVAPIVEVADIPDQPTQPTEPLVGTAVSALPALNHVYFRGHLGQGISKAKNLPETWDGPSGRNIKWKAKIPKPGYNSPVIWGTKLFLAGADAQGRWVFCFDRLTGDLLWQAEANNIPGTPATAPKTTNDTGLSAPTLTVDNQRVYAIFGTGDLIALTHNGDRVWAKNLGVPDNHYGHSSSLIYFNQTLIVQYDTNKSGRLLGLNMANGETIWETVRKSKISWSSPILAEIDGKMQVITTSAPSVAGFDAQTGQELWSVDVLSGEVGPSAAFSNGIVYAANEYASLVAIRPGPNPEILWQQYDVLPETASPAVAQGLIFIATTYGVLGCFDAKTGDQYWEEEFGQGFYGSPMIADGKVYVMDRGGTMHIYKLDKTPVKLGSPVLGEKSVVTPAFTDGTIYLRGEQFLYCIAAN